MLIHVHICLYVWFSSLNKITIYVYPNNNIQCTECASCSSFKHINYISAPYGAICCWVTSLGSILGGCYILILLPRVLCGLSYRGSLKKHYDML